MKNLRLLAIALCMAFFASMMSCQDANLTSPGSKGNDLVFLNEGYYPTSVGNTIKANYAGRQIDLVEIENGKYLYDGDVLLERGDFSINGEPVTEGVYAGRTWTGRNVRWRYASGVTQALKDRWVAAMQAWNTNLGFTFTQITSASGDYIQVQQNSSGQAYSTSIGRAGGRQIISVDPNYFSTGSVIHEIGHAMGLHHEQKRPDRNSYIVVNYSNIRPDWKSQYDACTSCTPTGTFDFGSIMLYGAFASSTVVYNTSIPAMNKLDGTTWTANRTNLSSGDIAAINTMY